MARRIFIGILALGFGILMITVTINAGSDEQEFIDAATPMRAVVIDEFRKSYGKGSDEYYTLGIQMGNSIIREEARGDPFGSYDVGDTIDILYNPMRHPYVMIDTFWIHGGSYTLGLVAGGILVLGALAAFFL
jgi:hypothetical protein